MLATGSDRTSVKFWDVATGRCLRILPNYTSEVWAVVFSPDGKQLATASEDKTIKLWDVETGYCLRTFQDHTQRVWAARFQPRRRNPGQFER